MAILDDILERVTSNTNFLNSIIANAKKIFELPAQTVTDLASKIHVSNSTNDSEYVTIQQIVDATGGGGTGASKISVTAGFNIHPAAANYWYTNTLNQPYLNAVGTIAGTSTLNLLYTKQNLHTFFTAHKDVKLKNVTVTCQNGRNETISIGIISNEKVNDTLNTATSALNGQTLLEEDMILTATNSQGVFNFDTTSGVFDLSINKGASVYLLFKSSISLSAIRGVIVTLIFEEL